MRNTVLGAALVAAGNVLIAAGDDAVAAVSHSAAAPVAASEPTLADKVRDFLANDTSGYDRRSAKAIGQAIGATENDVAAAARTSSELEVRNSTSGLGVLVSLRD